MRIYKDGDKPLILFFYWDSGSGMQGFRSFSYLHRQVYILLAVTILGIGLFACPAEARDFPDTENNPARIEIAHLKSLGILNGYDDGSFRPERVISRAEFTKMLVGALGHGEDAASLANGVSSYADVEMEFWAKGFIEIAREMDLADDSFAAFEPEAALLRGEAIAILGRVLLPNSFKEQLTLPPFIKQADLSPEALKELSAAYSLGLLDGYSEENFQPDEPLKRQEAAVLITRMMDIKGILYDFKGTLVNSDNGILEIEVLGKNRLFKQAADAVLVEQNRVVNGFEDSAVGFINFNVNSQGEIVFARLVYEDQYMDLQIARKPKKGLQSPVEADNPFTAQAGESAPASYEQPELSLKVNKTIIGIDAIQSEQQLTGEDLVVAVIDSGIDILHPDLQRTTNYYRKIIDWVNFTDEGRVYSPYEAVAANNSIQIPERGRITLPTTQSVSGKYRYGFWNEAEIVLGKSIDFTGNGLTDDQIMVLLVDSRQAGLYDVVFVDTNNNNSMADETPLFVYGGNNFNYASFPVTSQLSHGFPFVLTEISPSGEYVVFGYDNLGHGTHVAGIIAANGDIQGVAPGARLMAIKVLDSSGKTNYDTLLQGVNYAVQKGADVINISLGQYYQDGPQYEKFCRTLNDLARSNVICAASGNGGPGLSTIATPGDISNIISVGAYITPEMWSTDYGWSTPSEGMWFFNSAGPNRDGSLKPDILAPGSAVSTSPVWSGQYYMLREGTSMASPFVAGTIALLMEGMLKKGMVFNAAMIKQGLLDGANQIEGLGTIEQGHGLINAKDTWEQLQKAQELPRPWLASARTNLYGNARGLYARHYQPGIVQLSIDNAHNESLFIDWTTDAEWIRIPYSQVQVAPLGERVMEVEYYLPDQPGLYTGLLTGVLNGDINNKIGFFNTVVVPYKFDRSNEYAEYGSLEAGQMKRYYLEIPDYTEKLEMKLRIMGTLSDLQGRARIHVYDPSGREYAVSSYAGLAQNGLEPKREVVLAADKPKPGVWEIIVYSSATLSLFERKSSEYLLTASITTVQTQPVYIENNLAIGCVFPKSQEGAGIFRLSVLDENNLPYNGRLLINHKLYEVKDGRVRIQGKIEKNTLKLEITEI